MLNYCNLYKDKCMERFCSVSNNWQTCEHRVTTAECSDKVAEIPQDTANITGNRMLETYKSINYKNMDLIKMLKSFGITVILIIILAVIKQSLKYFIGYEVSDFFCGYFCGYCFYYTYRHL